MISLQKMQALSMQACLYSSVSCVHTHLVQISLISMILMDDRICRSTVDVRFVGYISGRKLSVLLNKRINLLNIVYHSWSGQMTWAVFISNTCSATLESFHPFVHLPLHNIFLHNLLIFLYESWKVLPPPTTKIIWQHVAQCLHYDYISFTECNTYPKPCPDLAQYVVCMIQKSGLKKLPRFYMQTALTFLYPS